MLLHQGATTNDAIQHLEIFREYRPLQSRFAPTTLTPENPHTYDDLPNLLFVGIEGSVDWLELVEMAQKQKTDLVVIGNRSPAFGHPTWAIDVACRFLMDSELLLVIEDDSLSPVPVDPCLVFRSKLLFGAPPVVVTLADLARELTRRTHAIGGKLQRHKLVEVFPTAMAGTTLT